MKVEWRGTDKLAKKFRSNMELQLAKQIVKTNGAELDRRMKSNAVFTRGYSTGATRRSINTSISDGGLTSTTKPGTHYSPYLEYGTRNMAAQPFVKPSWEVQKELFKRDMDRLK